MSNKYHIISSFICLHCCRQHRVEIGLPKYLVLMLKPLTFEDLLDRFPEVIEELMKDEFQQEVFQHFIFEHGQHDIRYFQTIVKNMKDIVQLRKHHYKKVVTNYEQYQSVIRAFKQVIRQEFPVPSNPAQRLNQINNFIRENPKKP